MSACEVDVGRGLMSKYAAGFLPVSFDCANNWSPNPLPSAADILQLYITPYMHIMSTDVIYVRNSPRNYMHGSLTLVCVLLWMETEGKNEGGFGTE